MKTNLLEVGMGAFVLIICILFGVFVYSTSQWKSPKGYEVFAKFNRIDGLMKGGEVRMSGVRVGHIKDMQLDPQSYMAVVRISLAPHVILPTDTSAEIVGDGLLGPKVMALIPGGDETSIPPDGEIIYTQAPVSLESLIGKFMFSTQEKKDEDSVEKVSDTH